MLKYAVILILISGILLFGCASNNPVHYNITDNTNYNASNNTDNNLADNTKKNATVPDLEFSVPSELPIAYVGKPYFYSFCNPQSTLDPESPDYRPEYFCGNNLTSINPKGGKPPYTTSLGYETEWFVNELYKSMDDRGILNFTPLRGDEGEYIVEVCAKDTGDYDYDRQEVCKNATLYIMSDVVTVKGEGEITHYLLLKLDSNVKASDFAGNAVEKDIKTGYVPTANFSFTKVTAEIQASPPSSEPGAWHGGGSYAAFDVTASADSVSVITDGNAACGEALGPEYPGDYNVDYYHVGFTGWDTTNVLLAMSITNTGTKDKAIDVHLEASSEVDSRSQNYVGGVTANAAACIGDDCVEVPTGSKGAQMKNSTVLRVLVRPGSHLLYYVGSMDDSFADTNTLHCPSFAKASSKVSVTIVPADMNDGKKAVETIYSYSYKDGSGGSYAK